MAFATRVQVPQVAECVDVVREVGGAMQRNIYMTSYENPNVRQCREARVS